MGPRTIDTLAKALASGLPRRGLFRRAWGGVAATLALHLQPGRAAQLVCEPCFCVDDGCQCCLSGITGGSLLRTATGDVQFVVFASVLRLQEGSSQAVGSVR